MDQQQSFRSTLVDWLKEIVPFNNFDAYVRKTRETFNSDPDAKRPDNSVTYIFCTDSHTYNIYALKDYLGATASTRKVRAGEDWTRGNDLPDGKFERATWDKIKEAIVRYEMVKLDLRPAPVPDIATMTMSAAVAQDEFATPLTEEEVDIIASGARHHNLGFRMGTGENKYKCVSLLGKMVLEFRAMQAELKKRPVTPVPDQPLPPCGNALCRVMDNTVDPIKVEHHLQCPERGPGWA